MSHKHEKLSQRQLRQKRVRLKVKGTSERPRLCVFRSLAHIQVQAIDDVAGVTIASASSHEKTFPWPEKAKPAPEAEVAAEVKEAPAKDAKAKDGKGKKDDKGTKKEKKAPVKGFKVRCSETAGELIAKRLMEKGISKAVFDRNGFLYHGRIKAVADAARKAGLQF